MICDHCDLRTEAKVCSLCGRRTRTATMRDAELAAKLFESRRNRSYGFICGQFPCVAITPNTMKATMPRRHLGHPIRPAGRGEGQRKRIKSGPQKRSV